MTRAMLRVLRSMGDGNTLWHTPTCSTALTRGDVRCRIDPTVLRLVDDGYIEELKPTGGDIEYELTTKGSHAIGAEI